MSNVISITEKLEIWKKVFSKDNMVVYSSTYGRFKFQVGNDITNLDFFDSVEFLKNLSLSLEEASEGMYNSVK